MPLRIVGGRVAIEAELDTGCVARRLQREIGEVYGYPSQVRLLGSGIDRGVRYLVRTATHAGELSRRAGLVDGRGRPVRGLPPAVVCGTEDELAAVWRGAFLARGVLPQPGRSASSALDVGCPSPEAAMALAGAARRLGVVAKAGEGRGAARVLVRDGNGDPIGELLTRIGTAAAVTAFRQWQALPGGRTPANRPASFDDANSRRSALAALTVTARAQRALQILADDGPALLLAAGRLRVQYDRASLEELGQLADPPITKDAVAGRIRRLLALADARARELGISDTDSTVVQDKPGR